MIISETNPNVGFAEIPEKPSDPPHSSPIVSLLKGAGDLLILLTFINPTNVFFYCFSNICRFRFTILLL